MTAVTKSVRRICGCFTTAYIRKICADARTSRGKNRPYANDYQLTTQDAGTTPKMQFLVHLYRHLAAVNIPTIPTRYFWTPAALLSKVTWRSYDQISCIVYRSSKALEMRMKISLGICCLGFFINMKTAGRRLCTSDSQSVCIRIAKSHTIGARVS